jgi:hypothetical protein
MAKTKIRFPRVPLPRQTGGAHRVNRELSAREELMRRLNEMHNDTDDEGLPDELDVQRTFSGFLDDDTEDYYDYLIGKMEDAGGGF